MSFLGTLLAGGVQAASAYANYQGQKETNEANIEMSREQRDFNAAEAQKGRDFSERMRSTQYQTAMQDMKAAGLNPMLAYQQGGAGTPSSATASQSSLPQIGNKTQAALTSSAMVAQIRYTDAQTEKTEADAEVSKAMAAKVEAETSLTTTSTANMQQTVERTRAEIDRVKQEVFQIRQQTSESVQRQVLIQYQTDLTKIEQDLAKGRITNVEAQTQLTKVQTQLEQYNLSGAKNRSDSDQTFWGRNVRPYIQDAGRVTNSATSIYQLRR